MFYKTIVLIKVLFIALNQIQTTDCLFVSVGKYPYHRQKGVNLPECGLKYKVLVHNISRSHKCYTKGTENATISVFPINHNNMPKADPISSRIYNGSDAMVGESPWTVRLFLKFRRDSFGEITEYSDVCSGSLITYEWILTAAHCVDRYKSEVLSIDVFAGARNVRNAVNLKKLFYHPGWVKQSLDKNSHDISLLKLEKKYNLDRIDNYYELNTICLPNVSKLNDNKENATFAGWGAINMKGTFPERLQIEEVVLKPHQLCTDSGILCADFVGKQPRTCKGDSGGPLYQFSGEEIPRAIQIGVLQSGLDCKEGMGWSKWIPPMRFMPWILEMISYY